MPPIDVVLAAAVRGERADWSAMSKDGQECAALVPKLWQRIAFHGIAPMLHAISENLVGWPDPLVQKIRNEAHMASLWEVTHRNCISDLIEAFVQKGIQSTIMKGTALAYSLYPDPSHRRRGDTDLLIRPGNTAKARKLLDNSGWIRRPSPQGLMSQETWIFDTGVGFIHELDLHWQVQDRATLQSVLPNEQFFEGTAPLSQLCAAARMPSLALSLIQIAINQAWHEARGLAVDGRKVCGGKRLIWAKDCDLLARSLTSQDWAAIIEMSEQGNIMPVVKDALEFARSVFVTPIPRDIAARLAKPTTNQTIVRYLRNPDLAREFLIDLRHTPGLRRKIELVRANALPSRPHLQSKYQDHAHWPTFALHARRLSRSVLRLVRASLPR